VTGAWIAGISWQYLQAAPLVGLLMLVLTIASAVLYWPQMRRMRRRWKVILPGLRLCGLVALGLSFLQPVITRAPAPAEKGAIVFVIDRSHGMGVVDRQRRPAQLVALADGLGRLPPGVRTHGDEIGDSLRKTRARLEEVSTAQSRLAFAAISGRSTAEATEQLYAMFPALDAEAASLLGWRSSLKPKSQLAVSLENLKKQLEAPRDPAHLDGWLTAVRAALDIGGTASEASQTVADETLYNTNKQVRSICDELQKLSRLGLVEQAIARPGGGLLASLPAKIPLYGFAAGDEVSAVALRGGGRPIRRLVLETQPATTELSTAVRGALDTLGGAPVDAVVLFSDGRRVGGRGELPPPALSQPVYVVAAAPSTSSQDWSLSHVSVPAGVRIDEKFTIHARVHGQGLRPGASVEVRCTIDDGGPGSVNASAVYSQLQRASLGADLSAEVDFTATISSAGSHRIVLQLPESPGEITSENNLIERWIKVYPLKLRAALVANSPGWDYRYLRDDLTARSGVELYSEVIEDESCALSPQKIREQDLVASALDSKQWEAVHRLLCEKGGMLVMVAGAEHLPQEYAGSLTRELLPYEPNGVAGWHVWAGEDPVFHFSAPGIVQGRTQANSWNALPPLFSYFAMPPLKPPASAILLERESGSPVLAAMSVGAGKSVLIGLDETWRWRRAAEWSQDNLWLNIIDRYVPRPFAAVGSSVALDLGKAAVGSGESTEVRVQVQSASQATINANVELRVLRDNKVIHTQALRPSSTRANEAVGMLQGLKAGSYRVQANVGNESVDYPLHVVDQYEAELEDASGDTASLERIARASGGRVLSLEQLQELPPLLRTASNVPRTVTLPLWDSSYLLVFVVACFTAEWALRKRLGLA
jgi:hypothetical protein